MAANIEALQEVGAGAVSMEKLWAKPWRAQCVERRRTLKSGRGGKGGTVKSRSRRSQSAFRLGAARKYPKKPHRGRRIKDAGCGAIHSMASHPGRLGLR
jgi:hypothetical protein